MSKEIVRVDVTSGIWIVSFADGSEESFPDRVSYRKFVEDNYNEVEQFILKGEKNE